MGYSKVVEHKISIASKLNDGEIGGSYYEAIMILSSIVSATACLLWPGDRIDRKRFVELLIKFNNTEYDFSTISIPKLFDKNFLSKEHDKELLKKYVNTSFSKILIGNDFDKSESDINDICNGIDRVKLRKLSYANLFYTEVRSALVHEYSISKNAEPYPMSQRDVFVSYNNNVHHPHRRIVFHFNPLKEIVQNVANNAYEILKDNKQKLPSKWWLEGI